MLLSTILLLFLTIFTYVCYKKFQLRTVLVNLPGPKPNFLVGNLIEFIGLHRYEYLDMMRSLFKNHGSIVKFNSGPLEVGAMVADVKFFEYVLSSTKLIDKSELYSYLHSWIGTGLLTSTGNKWKKRRHMLTPSFHFSILENFVDIFENVSDVLIEKLEKEVDKDSIDVCPLITLCTLDIISEAAMGIKINAQDNKNPEYVRCVKLMCKIFIDRVTSPLHPCLYPLTLNYYRERKALKVLHGYTDSIINKKISEKENRTVNDQDNSSKKKRLAFLDLLLESTIDGQPLSKTDIREEVDTFMFEGHDTTSATINFTLYSLATNPDVQQKAVEEQKTIFNNLKDAKPTIQQLNEMKYLDSVIKESLRLYPPIPIIARCLNEEIKFEGNVYPRGTNLLMLVFHLHRNPEFFPDPENFIPERFDGSNKMIPYSYVPFSAGPRNCIGQKFAMLEMKSVLSKVLRNFELIPAKPNHKLLLVPDIVLNSANGVCIALKKRN